MKTRTLSRKQRSAVFLDAAEKIFSGKACYYSCSQVCFSALCLTGHDSANDSANDLSWAYSEAFAAHPSQSLQTGDLRAAYAGHYPGIVEWRVTALCFAAAMAEAGDL